MKKNFIHILIFLTCSANAQDLSQYERHFYNAPELNMPYRYLRPAGKDSVYPLLIFLHGAAEKGFDNEQQLQLGGQFFLQDSIRQKYPAYILFPQCPEIDVWAFFETVPVPGNNRIVFPFLKKPTEVSGVLMKLIDSLMVADRIDVKRVYICGLSQGGMGVLDLIARYPQIFAAGISICGAGNAATSKKFAGKTSLWLIHGDMDPVIPVQFSRDYQKRLKNLNADVRYTEYAGVKHNSWINAFTEPDFMSWLFSRSKK